MTGKGGFEHSDEDSFVMEDFAEDEAEVHELEMELKNRMEESAVNLTQLQRVDKGIEYLHN